MHQSLNRTYDICRYIGMIDCIKQLLNFMRSITGNCQ